MTRYTPSGQVTTIPQNQAEFEKIQTAINDTLSRKGDTPNGMEADLDMNSNRILNLPAPSALTEPLRLSDLDSFLGGNLSIDLSSVTKVIDNVDTMKGDSTLNAGDVVLCKKYYSGGALVEGLIYEIQASQAVDGVSDFSLANGYTAVLIESQFKNILHYGADGTQVNDTVAFNAALAKSGYIDLQGQTLDVNVTATTTINGKDIFIKNGTLNFSSAPTLLRVFTLVASDLVRLENVKVTGDSNGTIDDSFDATQGTFALFRAELVADGAVKNIQIDNCNISGLVVCEDNKNTSTSATAFNVDGGYVQGSTFSNIAGHAFSFNAYKNIRIEGNKFNNIGALCADFACHTSGCTFQHNEINGAAGIAKIQNRFNSSQLQLPENNTISHNRAVNLTSGNSSNVAVVKLSGRNDTCEHNAVVYAGGTAVESIEVFGSATVQHNDITRTTNKTRSYITTVTDANLAGILDNPFIVIANNKGSGMLNFVRLQNTSIARITIEQNRPDDLARFVNGEANLNLPNLKIIDNEYDTSATTGAGMQFASTTVSLSRLKVQGNTCKSEGTGLVAWNAEGACVTGNSFEHATGNNFDIINTNSYVVTGNSANGTWATTTSQKIVEANTEF